MRRQKKRKTKTVGSWDCWAARGCWGSLGAAGVAGAAGATLGSAGSCWGLLLGSAGSAVGLPRAVGGFGGCRVPLDGSLGAAGVDGSCWGYSGLLGVAGVCWGLLVMLRGRRGLSGAAGVVTLKVPPVTLKVSPVTLSGGARHALVFANVSRFWHPSRSKCPPSRSKCPPSRSPGALWAYMATTTGIVTTTPTKDMIHQISLSKGGPRGALGVHGHDNRNRGRPEKTRGRGRREGREEGHR